jgi:hypothetical protein
LHHILRRGETLVRQVGVDPLRVTMHTGDVHSGASSPSYGISSLFTMFQKQAEKSIAASARRAAYFYVIANRMNAVFKVIVKFEILVNFVCFAIGTAGNRRLGNR